MKKIKLISLVSGAAFAATSLFGGIASAASGSMSLSGTTSQSNGNFTAAIYETSSDTINYAEAHLTFSAAVQNVSFDFSGSAFTAVSCGANCAGGYIPAGGTVTGTNKLATVHFTLASPSSVTVDFAGSSYMAHPNPGSVSTQIPVSGTPSTFTYSAPATGGGSGSNGSDGSNGGSSSSSSSAASHSTTHTSTTAPSKTVAAANTTPTSPTTPAANPEVKAAETGKKSDTTKKNAHKTATKKNSNSWAVAIGTIALLVVAGIAFVAGRKYVASKVHAEKAASEQKTAPATKPSKKPTQQTGKKTKTTSKK